MKRSERADLSKSLDELEETDSGNPDEALTPMVGECIRARKKPLASLSPDEIGLLVGQQDGAPFILDLVIPLLEVMPLLETRHYPGDVLSSLIRADQSLWEHRPEYREVLAQLYDRVRMLPADETEAFFDSLGIDDPHQTD